MILEIDQKPGVLDVSYLDKAGNKSVMQLPVPCYSQWWIDSTNRGTPGFIDISGKPVVKRSSKSFRTFDILEFFKSLPQATQDELFAYREANLIASDIETEMGDRFPKPELADQPVNVISCVDRDMNIVVYTTMNCQGQSVMVDTVETTADDAEGFPEMRVIQLSELAAIDKDAYEQKVIDGMSNDATLSWPTGRYLKRVETIVNTQQEIDKIITEQVKHLVAPHEQDKLHANILQFDTEKQMLQAWFSNVCKYAAVLAFWNGDGFDKPYLMNRCQKLGIDIACGSITGQIASMTNTPKHTVWVDYMQMVDMYDRRLKNKESLKLDYIAHRLLNVGKLPYRGTLKELYQHNVPVFIAYNVIDSILVQLIHRTMNLMATLYGFSQVCKMPLAKANSQVAQTEHLISLDTLDMLDTTGVDMPAKVNDGLIHVAAYNPDKPARRKYDGGHVKEPHKHIAKWCACVDFSGLYPSVHRSCNLSVENYIGPLANFEPKLQRQLLYDKNYFVSVNNKVYKNDRPYAYKRIQVFLRAKRDYHKKLMNKHLSTYQPFIEKALHERGVWHECPVVDDCITELIFPVSIDGTEYRPDLVHLNNPGKNDGYEHATDFLWFLFHENLRQGFFEMNMQVSYKLVANSLYGATANEFNAFSNVDVADDTTAEGRNSIITADKLINNWFNYEWPTDYDAHKYLLNKFGDKCTKLVQGDMPRLTTRDRIMYIDTDSLYIEFGDLMDACGYNGDHVDFFVDFYKGYLGNIIEDRLHAMTNGRHGQSMQQFDLEHISSDALFRRKKSYLKANTWDDGRKYDYEDSFEHLKTTGFSLARSFQSDKARTVSKRAIIEIMQGKWKTSDDYLRNMLLIWQDFQTWSIEDISKRMSIRKDQYESHILGMEPYPVFAPRTLPQYRGAAWYNWQLIQRKLTTTAENIEDGFVCFYEDAFGNHFAYRIFELPAWHPEPNKVVQFYKLVGDCIRDVASFYGIVCPLPIGTEPVHIEDDE